MLISSLYFDIFRYISIYFDISIFQYYIRNFRIKNSIVMIDYIQGQPVEVTPTYAVVDCNGLGYEINITLLDYPRISNERVKLYIHESIREDAHVLFGFLERRSRELFRLLIGVSGVGLGGKDLLEHLATLRSSEAEHD